MTEETKEQVVEQEKPIQLDELMAKREQEHQEQVAEEEVLNNPPPQEPEPEPEIPDTVSPEDTINAGKSAAHNRIQSLLSKKKELSETLSQKEERIKELEMRVKILEEYGLEPDAAKGEAEDTQTLELPEPDPDYVAELVKYGYDEEDAKEWARATMIREQQLASKREQQISMEHELEEKGKAALDVLVKEMEQHGHKWDDGWDKQISKIIESDPDLQAIGNVNPEAVLRQAYKLAVAERALAGKAQQRQPFTQIRPSTAQNKTVEDLMKERSPNMTEEEKWAWAAKMAGLKRNSF